MALANHSSHPLFLYFIEAWKQTLPRTLGRKDFLPDTCVCGSTNHIASDGHPKSDTSPFLSAKNVFCIVISCLTCPFSVRFWTILREISIEKQNLKKKLKTPNILKHQNLEEILIIQVLPLRGQGGVKV